MLELKRKKERRGRKEEVQRPNRRRVESGRVSDEKRVRRETHKNVLLL